MSSAVTKMPRTKTRPLVMLALSPPHVFSLGAAMGMVGVTLLTPPAALLGAANIFLYTSVYTPMKRTSIYNTWVGAVVGGIPPLMGYVSACGSLTPDAFLLFLLVFAWQFPHFNSLSYNLRKQYSRAGYHMMCVLDERLNKITSLR